MPPKASKRKAANGYRLPDPIPPGEVVTGISKKSWRIGKSIGIGGFGEIYLCSEDTSRAVGEDASLALKIEPLENGPLFVEMNFYIRAAQPGSVEEFKRKNGLSSLGMPVFRGSGRHLFKGDRYRFLVMDRYGTDLQKIFLSEKKLFPPKASYNVALKVLDILEYIHSKGYVHNDIKAQNLLLGHGRTKENEVYLVDFGLVSKYQKEGVHLEYKPDARKAHDGTIEYTSRDAHIGAHSRRSDLEILGYNLVHWMSGNLPWMDNLTNPHYVHTQKQGFMNDIPIFLQRCFGENDYPDVLLEFLTYVSNMDFDTAPDYDQCREMFRKALKKHRFPLDGKLDFSAPKSSLKKVGIASVTPPIVVKKKFPGAKAKKLSEEDEEEQRRAPEIQKTEQKSNLATPKRARSARREYKDSASQTSPDFVKRAKVAVRAKKKGLSQPTEMEEFAEMAVKSAVEVNRRNASAARGRQRNKSPATKKPKSIGLADKSQNELVNPTPAMLELIKKRKKK